MKVAGGATWGIVLSIVEMRETTGKGQGAVAWGHQLAGDRDPRGPTANVPSGTGTGQC